MNTKNILLEVYKEVLTEAVNADEIKKFIAGRTLGATMYEILSHLNIKPSSPPNSQQVGAFLAVKRLLNKGELERSKVGKSFVYSKPKTGIKSNQTTPTPQSKPAKVVKPSLNKVKNSTQKFDKIIEKINAYLTKYGYKNKVEKRQSGDHFWAAIPIFKNGTEYGYYEGDTPVIQYYLDGINKGKITIRPTKSQSEIGLTSENLKAAMPPKKTASIINKERKTEELIKQINNTINSSWPNRGTWELDNYNKGNNTLYYYLDTNERGPRTDHGGPPDGDGWMTYDQIERLRKSYEKKWKPILKDFMKGLRSKGIKAFDEYVEYGEKGHIALQIKVVAKMSKPKV